MQALIFYNKGTYLESLDIERFHISHDQEAFIFYETDGRNIEKTVIEAWEIDKAIIYMDKISVFIKQKNDKLEVQIIPFAESLQFACDS